MSKIKIFALGGLNEDGKNMYVVEADHDIFIFDAGLKYADDKMLGVDYIIPNYDYIKKNRKNIKGIFITHGHYDNMGALSEILKEVPDLPIYGTSFTMEIIKDDLLADNLSVKNLRVIKPHRKINFGKNSIFPISLTHMVPDNVGYVLYTPDGAIFYTGNFVFDSTMLGAYKTDIGKLAYVGKQGVLCLLSESLYADKQGFTSPNHRTAKAIREVINETDGRILYNIYQAQLYRIQELFNEIKNTDRNVVIMGKSLESVILKAIDSIMNNKGKILLRNFSVRVFNNSKIVENNANKIFRIYNEFSNEEFKDFNSLIEHYYIYRNFNLILIKGDITLKINEEIIHVGKLNSTFALSSEILDKVEIINLPVEKVITIENQTTFNYFSDSSFLVLYSDGYISSAMAMFLKKLYSFKTSLRFYHFGDIDRGGINIYLDIIAKTGIKFNTYKMDIETLKEYQSYAKSLTEKDKENLISLIKNAKDEEMLKLVDFMLSNNIKLEQEAID